MRLPYKQVIVVRHDLHMRMGKAVAQGAHASMMFLISALVASENGEADLPETIGPWISEAAMAKICVRVESEQELADIEAKASEAGLLVYPVTDAGHTEFRGVPTRTCVAIGPNRSEEIDAVTGHLRLL
jgi:PTH2 family peptidyl-tRNA hydrolase